jgi:basic membrane protein A and related proteins
MMVEEIKEIKAGTWKPSNMRGDLGSGNAVLDPFGAAVPEDVRKQVLQLKADIIAGKKSIWEGPITKQDGTVVVPAGKKLAMEQVETMDYLVKGVVGATK